MSVRYSAYSFPVKVTFDNDDDVAAPEPEHLQVTLSQLSQAEREGWLTWLAERGRDGVLNVQKLRDGTFQARVKDPLMHPNRQFRQSMPNMGSLVIPQSIFPEPDRVSGKGKKTSGRRGRALSAGKERVSIRSVHWLLQIIDNVYTARFKTYSVELADMGAEFEEFSSFVYHALRDRFGLEKLVIQKSKEVMASIKQYRSTYPEIDLFGKFVQGIYDSVDVLFYLVARNKILAEALVEDPVPTGAQRFLPKKQNQVKKLVIPGRRIVPLVTLVLAKQPPELTANVLRRLEEGELSNSGRIDVHEFMTILVEVYHEHNVAVQESLALQNLQPEQEHDHSIEGAEEEEEEAVSQDEDEGQASQPVHDEYEGDRGEEGAADGEGVTSWNTIGDDSEDQDEQDEY